MDPVQERELILATLQDSVARLETSLNVQLIPAEGMSFGFALRGARDGSGVAAVPGGIRAVAGKPEPAGPGTFGTDEPAVRIILTMMKFNPSMRSAALVRHTERIFSILEDDLFLECASFATGGPDRGISTLDWGIASCCKKGIPDVIHMKNPDKNLSRLIICGEDPADVANNIIICSNRI